MVDIDALFDALLSALREGNRAQAAAVKEAMAAALDRVEAASGDWTVDEILAREG
jgi:hypothetical protein